MWICPFGVLLIILTSSQTLYRSFGSKYGWQWRSLHIPSRKSMCAGLCDFRSEACSARVSGQTRAIFRQKLRCAGCWVKSGEFSSESIKNNFLGKLKRFSVRNLKCAGFWKNRARIGQKIQYTDFKANSGGFRSENKMFRFFAQTRAIFGQKFEYADFGQNWGFSWWNFYDEWNLDEMFALFARWFFRTDFRTFRAFSHDFRTTCFFKVFFRTDFRTFRAFSHDFRTTCFFKVFCSHVSRVFARSSHAGRRPACLCQIRSKSAQIWRKSLVSIGAPQNFWIFTKKNLDQLKLNTSECFGYLYSWFCVKTEDSPTHFDDFLKNFLANLNWTLQNFPQQKQQRVFRIEIFTYFVSKYLKFIKRSRWFWWENGWTSSNQRFQKSFCNNDWQHAFQITFFKYFCLSCIFHSIWPCGFSCFKRLTLISGLYVQRARDGGCTTRFEFPCSSEAKKENIQRRINCCDPFWSDT